MKKYINSIISWGGENLFSSWKQSVLSLLALYFIYNILIFVLDWGIFSASWQGEDRTSCLKDNQGACWIFVFQKFNQFIYGHYPLSQQWRVNLVFVMGALGLIGLIYPKFIYKRGLVLIMLFVYPWVTLFLLSGGVLGLSYVETRQWGGLMVTLLISITGIVCSLPLGIMLALGRRSKMPVIRLFCIGFIEIWRAVPLIMVLFMANLMFPLFLPEGVSIDGLLRSIVGVALFASAYMAEVIRGGLQAIPKGQYEVASALGIPYWKSMRFVILPQSLAISIPGIVNTFIGLFKDTTLVSIVGIFDLLGVVQANFADPQWIAPQVPITGYVFTGGVFWVFCFLMSRYSLHIEKRVIKDHKDK